MSMHVLRSGFFYRNRWRKSSMPLKIQQISYVVSYVKDITCRPYYQALQCLIDMQTSPI